MVQMNSAPLRSAALIEDDQSSVAPKKTKRQQKRSGANKKPGAAVMLQKHYAQMPSAEVVEDLHGSTQLHVDEDVERGVAMIQQSTAQCQTALLEMEPELGSAMLQKNAAQAPAKVLRRAVKEDDGQGHLHAKNPASSKKHVEKEVSAIVAHDRKVRDTAAEESSEDKKLLGHKAQKTSFDGDDKKAKNQDNETKSDVAAAGMRAKEAGTFDADDHEAGTFDADDHKEAEDEEQQQDANQGEQEEIEGEEEEESEKPETEPTQIMTSPNKILSKDMAAPKATSSKEQDDALPVDQRFKDKYNRFEKEDKVVQDPVAAVTKTDKPDQEAARIQRSTLAKQTHKAAPKKAASTIQKAKAQELAKRRGGAGRVLLRLRLPSGRLVAAATERAAKLHELSAGLLQELQTDMADKFPGNKSALSALHLKVGSLELRPNQTVSSLGVSRNHVIDVRLVGHKAVAKPSKKRRKEAPLHAGKDLSASTPVKKHKDVGSKEKITKVTSPLAKSVHFDDVNPESDRKAMKREDEDVKPKESGHPCQKKEGCPGDR